MPKLAQQTQKGPQNAGLFGHQIDAGLGGVATATFAVELLPNRFGNLVGEG
jgi:hypothetical protein